MKGTRAERKLLNDESGGALLLVLLGCLAVVTFLAAVFNMGVQVMVKTGLQGIADAAALTGTSWLAAGLNTLAFINFAMMTIVALVVALALIGVALGACSSLVFVPVLPAVCAAAMVPYYRVVVPEVVPKLWKASIGLQRTGNVYMKLFPIVAAGDTFIKGVQESGDTRRWRPFVVFYPLLPGTDSDDGFERLSLHVEKGAFEDFAREVEKQVGNAINKLLEGTGIFGGPMAKAAGWIGGKAASLATSGVGNVLGTVLSDGGIQSEHGEEKNFERVLRFDINPSLVSSERGYFDPRPPQECTQEKCRQILHMLKKWEEVARSGEVSATIEPLRHYRFVYRSESEGMRFTRVVNISLRWRYYHLVWNVTDEDVDGDGRVQGDGCRRRWAGTRSGDTAGFRPFQAMQERLVEVIPEWLHRGENLRGAENASCRNLDYEVKVICDGTEYVKERFVLRDLEARYTQSFQVSPPPEMPAPFVLHAHAFEKLRMAVLAWDRGRTRRPYVLEHLMGDGAPAGTFAVAQACAASPSAVPGEAFFHWDWTEFLCPVSLVRELARAWRSAPPNGDMEPEEGTAGDSLEEWISRHVLVH